jgi:Eukaryotic aspartyl protease
MKFFTTSAILSVAALSSFSFAAVTIGISKGNAASASKRHLRSRATVLEELGNNFTGQSYMAIVTVGTPPQDISLAVDTGSSDTWVLDVTTDLCTSTALQAVQMSGCETPCPYSLPLSFPDSY